METQTKFVAVFAYCCSKSRPIAVAEANTVEELVQVLEGYGIDILKHELEAEDIDTIEEERDDLTLTQYLFLKNKYPEYMTKQECVCQGDECTCPAHIYESGTSSIVTWVPTDGLRKLFGKWPSVWEDEKGNARVTVGVMEILRNKPMFTAVAVFEEILWG